MMYRYVFYNLILKPRRALPSACSVPVQRTPPTCHKCSPDTEQLFSHSCSNTLLGSHPWGITSHLTKAFAE